MCAETNHMGRELEHSFIIHMLLLFYWNRMGALSWSPGSCVAETWRRQKGTVPSLKSLELNQHCYNWTTLTAKHGNIKLRSKTAFVWQSKTSDPN